MTHQELVDYIVNELSSGKSEVEIRKTLLASGWQDADITENLELAKSHVPTVGPMSATETKEKISFLKKHSRTVVVLTVGGLLLAGLAFAAYKYVAPPAPEKLLQEARVNLGKANSLDFSGRITADVDSPNNLLNLQALLPKAIADQIVNPKIAGASTNLQFAMDFDGTIDATDDTHPKGQLNFNLQASIFTAGVKVRLIDNIVYLQLTNIPKISEEFDKYVNTWIKVDPESLSKEYGLGIDYNNGKPNLTSGQKKQIEDLTAKAHWFNSATKLDNDTIDGQTMYHYAIVIDKIGLKNYLGEVEKINKSAGGFPDSSIDALDTIRFDNVEVWVGKNDRMIHRISGKISQAASNDAIPASGSVNILLNFSNFNKPSVIEAPADAKNLEDIIKELTASTPIPPVPTKK